MPPQSIFFRTWRESHQSLYDCPQGNPARTLEARRHRSRRRDRVAGLVGCGGASVGTSTGSRIPPACAKLSDIDHVIILIQENRSFDHYFGSYRGVRGFSDQSAAFQQPDPANTAAPPLAKLLPFHLDTSITNAACTHDIMHDWVPQHLSWNNGAMDGFVTSRLPINPNDAVLTMG